MIWTYLTLIRTLVWDLLVEGLRRTRTTPEAGYSTETVLVTALLVGLGLLVVGSILWNAVVDKANSIDLG